MYFHFGLFQFAFSCFGSIKTPKLAVAVKKRNNWKKRFALDSAKTSFGSSFCCFEAKLVSQDTLYTWNIIEVACNHSELNELGCNPIELNELACNPSELNELACNRLSTCISSRKGNSSGSWAPWDTMSSSMSGRQRLFRCTRLCNSFLLIKGNSLSKVMIPAVVQPLPPLCNRLVHPACHT